MLCCICVDKYSYDLHAACPILFALCLKLYKLGFYRKNHSYTHMHLHIKISDVYDFKQSLYVFEHRTKFL